MEPKSSNPTTSCGSFQEVHCALMRLLVRNLPTSASEAEIRALFETYGTVQSCTLVMDKETKRSKGFGFVEMPKPGAAKAAVFNLNGIELDGSKIRVKKAKPTPK